MQFSSSGSVVSPSRRPTPASCWARARQLGGRPANAARTLSVRWKSGGEAEGGVGVLASRALVPLCRFLQVWVFVPGPQGALQGFSASINPLLNLS